MFEFRKERGAASGGGYATRADYCRIFQDDMSRLYLLSFLLTADHATAEKCYVDSIDNAVKGYPVFTERARSWSKRTVVQSAIRLVFPERVQGEARAAGLESSGNSVIDIVIRLAPLERFVFVMSVLERYSERECSVLLNCAVQEVVDALLRALRAISTSSIGADRADEDVSCSLIEYTDDRGTSLF